MQPLFEIGQEIVCVDAKSKFGCGSPLVENKRYPCKGLNTCQCGSVHVDVRIRIAKTNFVCTTCFNAVQSEVWWFKQNRFATEEHMVNVNELIEETTYETIRTLI